MPVIRSPLNVGRSLRKASGSRSITATEFPRSSRMWASVEPTRPHPMITICTTRPFTVRHSAGSARFGHLAKGMPSHGRMRPQNKEVGFVVFEVGEAVEVTTQDVAQGGWCVATPPGVPVLFVRHPLPGERGGARGTEVTARV